MIHTFRSWITEHVRVTMDQIRPSVVSEESKKDKDYFGSTLATSAFDKGESTTRDVDVLIVGGGIVGASLAFYLARDGDATTGEGKCSKRSIQIVERGHVGSEASGLSAGTIWAAGPGDLTHPGLLLGSTTMELVRELSDSGKDIELEVSGALSIATSEAQKEMQRRSVRRLVPHGYEGTMLVGREAVLRHVPTLGTESSIVAASFWPQSAHVDPHKLTLAIADEAEKLGVNVEEGVSVVAIAPLFVANAAGDEKVAVSKESYYRYEISTDSGITYRAHDVVFAAGAWCGCLGTSLGLRFPVVPVKGQMWITEPVPQDTMPHLIFTTESHEWWSRNSSRDDANGVPEYCTHDHAGRFLCRHAYGRQKKDGCIIFGGDRVPCASDDYSINEDDYRRNHAYVEEFFTHLKSVKVEGSWAGIMGFSMDGKPLIGGLGKLGYPGLWVAAGFGPHGIMEGPGAMKFLASMMRGEIDREDARTMGAFDPAREGGVVRDS
eukprot:g935.t1